MLNDVRDGHYAARHPGRPLTPAMQRRIRHKEGSRKTHEHHTEMKEGLEVQVRCTACAPLPWKVITAVKSEEGPRDWKPDNAA